MGKRPRLRVGDSSKESENIHKYFEIFLTPEKGHFRGSTLLNGGVGVVVVDALEILRFHLVPSDIGVGIELEGDGADEVFDEDGILVGAFGDSFFIAAFEEGIKFGTGGAFDEGDEV